MPAGIKLALGLLWLAVLVGAVAGLARMVAARRRPGLPMLLLVAMFAVLVASLWVAIAVHVSHGGGQHPRYLFPVIAIIALAIAGGLRAVPGGPPGLWLVAGLWVQAATVLSWLLAQADAQHPAPLLDRLPTALRDAQVPLAPVVVVLLLGVTLAGLLLASRSILVLAGEPIRRAVTEPATGSVAESAAEPA
jgi:hypothetical protein